MAELFHNEDRDTGMNLEKILAEAEISRNVEIENQYGRYLDGLDVGKDNFGMVGGNRDYES